MGKAKKTRKFAVAKRVISPKDSRVKSNQKELAIKKKIIGGRRKAPARRSGRERPLLPVQHPARPAVPRPRRYEFHQLLDTEQDGRRAVDDGLPPRQVRAVHNRLRHGGAREARVQVQGGAASRAGSEIRADTVRMQRVLRRRLPGEDGYELEVFHRRHVRQGAEGADKEDTRGAGHVHQQPPVHRREDAGGIRRSQIDDDDDEVVVVVGGWRERERCIIRGLGEGGISNGDGSEEVATAF